jgi:hypothetical protein
MGKGNRIATTIPRLEAIRCTCIDCQCRKPVQQGKPNMDLYKSHFPRTNEPMQFDTTVRSNFKEHGIAPTPVYRKEQLVSTVTFGQVNFG